MALAQFGVDQLGLVTLVGLRDVVELVGTGSPTLAAAIEPGRPGLLRLQLRQEPTGRAGQRYLLELLPDGGAEYSRQAAGHLITDQLATVAQAIPGFVREWDVRLGEVAARIRSSGRASRLSERPFYPRRTLTRQSGSLLAAGPQAEVTILAPC